MSPYQRSMADAWYDITRISRYTALLTSGAGDRATVVRPARSEQPTGNTGFLTGSFNPPTSAHLALIAAACEQAALDEVFFATSRTIVDKEGVTRALMEDRLLLMDLIAGERPQHGVLLFTSGLYYGQVQELRAIAAGTARIFCIIGYDKLVQIFDPRYYQDRDAALQQLFSATTLLVAPRHQRTEDDVTALLATPDNRQFRDAVRLIRLPPAYLEQSSTAVRTAVAAGHLPADIPPVVAAFIRETGAYAAPRKLAGGDIIDAYGLRIALLRLLIGLHASRMLPQAEHASAMFQALFCLAIADNAPGHRLRSWLQEDANRATPAAQLAFLRRCYADLAQAGASHT